MYNKSLIVLNGILDPTKEGHFNFCVLLYMLLDFCEDYKCVVVNARH